MNKIDFNKHMYSSCIDNLVDTFFFFSRICSEQPSKLNKKAVHMQIFHHWKIDKIHTRNDAYHEEALNHPDNPVKMASHPVFAAAASLSFESSLLLQAVYCPGESSRATGQFRGTPPCKIRPSQLFTSMIQRIN